jgi:primary-amine oxidase
MSAEGATSTVSGDGVATAAVHPLDPLSHDEVVAAVEILRAQAQLPQRHRFVTVVLHEPDKETVLAFEEGHPIEREAFLIVLNNEEESTYEAVVSVTAREVRSWGKVSDIQPPIVLEEFDDCEQACKESPEFRAALARRGITDMELVIVDPWSAGSYGDEEGRRLSRALVWVREFPDDHAYAHPVDNIVAVVDLNKMSVVRIEDYGVVPVPKEHGNYTAEAVDGHRETLKPLDIRQDQGPSFELRGYEVRWQNWRMRVGFTPREGLVLHTVGYEDASRVRTILHRASLSEMVVPYGDPRPTQWRKNAFDAGEYNVGALANSLERGCDCLGEIRYLDAVMADGQGRPLTIKNAICIHEEDYGVLWKHLDFRTEETEVRRSRRLVISSFSTVANYEYGWYWYFYQDGTIEFEAKLTGVVSTGALAPGEKSRHGQLLTPEGLYAPIHQHFFNFRLDLDIEGRENTVYEVHTEAEPPGEGNPHGNAYFSTATPLTRESEAQQIIDPLAGRYWKIVNPSVKNRLGEPVGYRLMPKTNVLPFAQPESSVMKRAAFTRKHLWVTPYERAERHAAGDYPNQHAGGAGLPEWTQADRPIEDTDVVVWYTLGSHHPVRPEDWPVMPVQYAGFMLQPFGFFERNPALDVPAPQHQHVEGNGAHGAT